MKVRIWNKDWDFNNGYLVVKSNDKHMFCPNIKTSYRSNGYNIPSKLTIPKTVFNRLLKNGNLILTNREWSHCGIVYIFKEERLDE